MAMRENKNNFPALRMNFIRFREINCLSTLPCYIRKTVHVYGVFNKIRNGIVYLIKANEISAVSTAHRNLGT